jgi:hypothetical protein
MINIIHHVTVPTNKGGLGIMATHSKGDSFVKIATSHCSVNDQYNKKIACTILEANMQAERYIKIPLPFKLNRHKISHRDLRNMVIDLFYF